MNPVHLIEKKRDGQMLSEDEIRWFIDSYTADKIQDYQMSAMLMAIYFQGMNPEELTAFTQAMIESGDSIDLSSIPGCKIDKHSTGGVGDKVSLILAPLVASAGITVPMMAGRGLGHTGGTLDKLESIPGFRTRLSQKEFVHQLNQIGCAIIGQTERVAPADRKLYALRDVTGTVPSIPLICSSILSKKKAEGADGLVLDVKIGQGAFLVERDATYALARKLVELGNTLGLQTQALLTRMDQPLGYAIGNWLEVMESVDVLQGKGPKDLIDVTVGLGSVMLVMAGKVKDYIEGYHTLKKILQSGQAWQRFVEMVGMQGGNIGMLHHVETYPKSRYQFEVKASKSGFLRTVHARHLGRCAMMLGAGRMKKEDSVDPKAGILISKKIGDSVAAGDVIATLYSDDSDAIESMVPEVKRAIQIHSAGMKPGLLIECLIKKEGEERFPELR